MILDSIIVGIIVTAAAAYLVWHFMPKPRKTAGCPVPCGHCLAKK